MTRKRPRDNIAAPFASVVAALFIAFALLVAPAFAGNDDNVGFEVGATGWVDLGTKLIADTFASGRFGLERSPITGEDRTVATVGVGFGDGLGGDPLGWTYAKVEVGVISNTPMPEVRVQDADPVIRAELAADIVHDVVQVAASGQVVIDDDKPKTGSPARKKRGLYRAKVHTLTAVEKIVGVDAGYVGPQYTAETSPEDSNSPGTLQTAGVHWEGYAIGDQFAAKLGLDLGRRISGDAHVSTLDGRARADQPDLVAMVTVELTFTQKPARPRIRYIERVAPPVLENLPVG